MSNYRYHCTNCNKDFDSEFIESKLIYLCPYCGSSEKNEPLKGVLTIEYDYESLKKSITKEKLLSSVPGKFWLYSELWPIDFNKIPEKDLELLSLPSNQLLRFDNNLLFQDETRNPTYSYKDRASILVALKAKELGITEIAAASTGNAGSSLAGICARLGLKAHIFVPKNIPEAKRIQIQSYGAEIYLVDGDYDQAFDLCLEVSLKKNWYNRNTAFNPLTIEGKKSAAFDIFISTEGNIPDNIFIPVGDGVIIGGLYKGFDELKKLDLIEKLPKLIAVQAEGSSAVVDYLSSNEFNYAPAYTIADSISAGAPRNLFMATEAVEETDGLGLKVNDNEILASQKELAYKFGLLVEPSCAAAYAGYLKIKNELPDKTSLLLMTGSGLKDSESLKKWNREIDPQSYDELKRLLIDD